MCVAFKHREHVVGGPVPLIHSLHDGRRARSRVARCEHLRHRRAHRSRVRGNPAAVKQPVAGKLRVRRLLANGGYNHACRNLEFRARNRRKRAAAVRPRFAEASLQEAQYYAVRPRLDRGWLQVIDDLHALGGGGGDLVFAGRDFIGTAPVDHLDMLHSR